MRVSDILNHRFHIDAATDAYLRRKERLLSLLRDWVAGRYMNCQGNVAGSDHAVDGACSHSSMLELRAIHAAIWRAPATIETETFYRGAYIPANITRLKGKTIARIPMRIPFSVSRRARVARSWAGDMDDHKNGTTTLVPCLFRITVPKRCPVLRVSQSQVLYDFAGDDANAALVSQYEVVLCAGALHNVTWEKTIKKTPAANRFLVCACTFSPSATTPTQKRRKHAIVG